MGAPRRHVSLNKHAGEPERYVIFGDLARNGVEYEVGDWVIVPVGVEHEVSAILVARL